MMTTDIQKHPDFAKRTWWWSKDKKAPDVACPQCETLYSLFGFDVSARGIVKPTVKCSKCGWTDLIRLLNWKHGKKSFPL